MSDDYTIVTTETGGRMAITEKPSVTEVHWELDSGSLTDSEIRIPTQGQTRNPKGVAAALRALATYVEERGDAEYSPMAERGEYCVMLQWTSANRYAAVDVVSSELHLSRAVANQMVADGCVRTVMDMTDEEADRLVSKLREIGCTAYTKLTT